MSTEARAKPKASTTGRRAQGGFDRAGAALEPSRLAHQQALQSGSELVRQQLGSTALADACRGEFAKAMGREMDLATIKPLGSQIAEQIAADRERLKQITEGFSSIRLDEWGCPNSMDRSHATINFILAGFAWRSSKETGVQ